MNANELHARTLTAQGRAAGASAMPEDPASRAVIQEAQAACQREKNARLMEQDEVFTLFGARTTDDPVFLLLQALNFGAMGVQMVPGSRWRGTQDRGELVFERHRFEQWRTTFEDVAQRLGYTRKR